MTCPKSIGSRQKSETGNNHGRQQTTSRDNWCFNCNGSHSKSNKFSLLVIYVSLPLNNSVVNPSQMSLVSQQSSSFSHFTLCDNRCFNYKDINSKWNELKSPVIPLPPPFNDFVINPTHLYSFCQQSSISSHNTTHELQSSSIAGRTSPDPSNTMPLPSTNKGRLNIYGCTVEVSKLILAQQQQQQNTVMFLRNYHEFCNTNDPSSTFLSPPHIPKTESLSQSTISSLDSRSISRNQSDMNIQQPIKL